MQKLKEANTNSNKKNKKQENQNGNHVGEEGCWEKMARMRGKSYDR
jgi:hypothetical protein